MNTKDTSIIDQDAQTTNTLFNVTQDTQVVDLELKQMKAGDVSTDIQQLLNANGEEIGQMKITIEKISDVPQPFTTEIQDYWQADGTYVMDIEVSGTFPPFGMKSDYYARLNYEVRNGCSSLYFYEARINHKNFPPEPWLWDPDWSEEASITKRSGSSISADAVFYYYYELPMGDQGLYANLETGVRILPSDPGYVRIWFDINDGK